MRKTLGEIGEHEAVRRLVHLAGSARVPDDCAVLRLPTCTLVATTDILNEGQHFPRGASAELIGWHSVAVTLSDIAAMGARPLGLMMALSMPRSTELQFAEGLMAGARDCAESCGTHVVGGDTKEGRELTICTSGVGAVNDGEPLMRNGVREGDVLCHTGRIGRAALWQLRKDEACIEQMLRFVPRVREGIALQGLGATACIDISDGLALSIHYLAEASEHGFEVKPKAIGFHNGLREEERQAALHLGGDYELLFTVPKDRIGEMRRALAALGTEVFEIGEVSGSKVIIELDGRSVLLPRRGYEHFRGVE
ncbi:MAG: thiamine-phosphate kinase [Candidatus Thermoplasmatota archaeon]